MASEAKPRKKASAEQPDRPRRKTPKQTPEESAPAEPGSSEVRPPIIPLLWLLVPFVAVLTYGLLTR